jgi:hypothetical protein
MFRLMSEKLTINIFKKVIITGFIFFALINPTAIYSEQLSYTSVLMDTLLHFGQGVKDFLGADQKSANMKHIENQNFIQVLRFGFRTSVNADESLYSMNAAGLYSMDIDPFADIVPEVIGPALCYPNPFKQETGGTLGYRLSKHMDLDIYIYDMMANLIFKNTLYEGSIGGRAGYNKVVLNAETLNGFELSCGVYFYLLVHEGEVLAKGKMAVKP